MAQGMRPGGLTALAVVNFVLAGMGVLGAFGLIMVLAMGGAMIEAGNAEGEAVEASGSTDPKSTASGSEGAKSTTTKKKAKKKDPGQAANEAQIRRMQENQGKVFIQIGLEILIAILMLLSGLGYLGQKRVMGRLLGSATAVLILGAVVFQLTYLPFGIEHMSSFIYPVLTLILLNTTFRPDLVN